MNSARTDWLCAAVWLLGLLVCVGFWFVVFKVAAVIL